MTNTNADPTLDRLLRHMAWANAQLIARLREEPIDALTLAAPRNEWPAGRNLAHLQVGHDPELADQSRAARPHA